jgi:hypothetical protein
MLSLDHQGPLGQNYGATANCTAGTGLDHLLPPCNDGSGVYVLGHVTRRGGAVMPPGPVVARLALGAQLRRLRAQARQEQAAAATAIQASTTKISRMEGGQTSMTRRDISELLNLYGVTDPELRDRMLGLADQSQEPGWYGMFPDVLSASMRHSLSLEAEASVIMTYDPMAVPALLQTSAYARSVASRTPDDPRWRGGLGVRARARRRALLEVADPPRLWALIHEAVLARAPGGDPRILRGQLESIRADVTTARTGKAPNITVQIVPDYAQDALLAPGPFTILRFPHPDVGPFVCYETLSTIRCTNAPAEADAHQEIFDSLSIRARPPDLTVSMLDTFMKRLPARTAEDSEPGP